MQHLLTFILRMLANQRGEVGDDDDSDSDNDTLDDDDVIEIDPNDLGDDDDDDDDDSSDGDDDSSDDNTPDFKAELAKSRDLLKKQDKTIKENNRNFYNMRKKFEKLEADSSKDKDTQFTDTQLKNMIEENQDDPGVMLQIMKHVSKQVASGEAKGEVIASEIAQRKKEMDDYLLLNYPDAYTEGSKDHQSIQQAKDYLHLNDHPLADTLAAAVTAFLQQPDLLEAARKEGRESAAQVETNRKKSIKENSLETGKKKVVAASLPSDHAAMAKQLGLTTKKQIALYKQLLNKGKNTAAVEV